MHWVDGGGSVLGVLAAMGLCAAVGAVLALPALRLRGLYLALATLAFAVLMDQVFFTSTSVMGQGGAIPVGRPDIFGMRFTTDRSFDVLLAVVLALCVVGRGRAARGPLRPAPGVDERLPGGVQHRGLQPHPDQAGRSSPSRPAWPVWPEPSTAVSTRGECVVVPVPASIAIFAGVTLAGVNLMTGAVLTGVFLAIGPVIGAHIPSIPDFTQLGIGVGVVTIGRNPNGVGRLYDEVGERWAARRQRRVPLADQLRPCPGGRAGGMEPEVRSVG